MMNFEAIAANYPSNLRVFRRNILREYLQYHILQTIFNSPLATKLSFIGGTALRIIHGNNRFSEDLDFDNFGLTQKEFESLSRFVKQGLEREGYEVEIRNVYKKTFCCYLRFPKLLFVAGLTPIEEEKILVQLDTYGHRFVYRPERIILNKFDVFSEIFATPTDILLSQKISAALTRKRAKGRDFFDIVFLAGKTKPNYQYLKMKIGVGSGDELKKEMLKQSKERNFNKLAKEAGPFLFSPGDNKRITLFPDWLKEAKL